jgi:hypothetical protein
LRGEEGLELVDVVGDIIWFEELVLPNGKIVDEEEGDVVLDVDVTVPVEDPEDSLWVEVGAPVT